MLAEGVRLCAGQSFSVSEWIRIVVQSGQVSSFSGLLASPSGLV